MFPCGVDPGVDDIPPVGHENGKGPEMRKLAALLNRDALHAPAEASSGGRANPLLHPRPTPYGLPDFAAVEVEHFEPAFGIGIAAQEREIAAIREQEDAPTFENTIVALENSGALLRRVGNLFYALNGTMTNDSMQAVARAMAPRLSAHHDAINLDTALFARVDAVYQQREALGLDPQSRRLLEETRKDFVRSGALLDAAGKKRMAAINQRLSVLTLQFGQNVLEDTNRFTMTLTDPDDLAGLPPAVIQAAAETAVERGAPQGSWVFTIHKPSLIPFLQFSAKRELRQRMFEAYAMVGNHGDARDNNAICAEIAALRLERARLLGYPSHAHYTLDDTMAGTPENVDDLLRKVWDPALRRAAEEAAEFQALIDAEGEDFRLAAWDWWHYAQKVKKQKYALDEEMLRPYFQLENVRQGMFDVATRLYGLRFTELPDAPRYIDEVDVFLVQDADGTDLAVLSLDYFQREGKRSGAWMSSFRRQCYDGDERVLPLIYNVGNFTRPTENAPALLNADEVATMFHEFGHALHGMLSDVRYRSLSGTSVSCDFVELPSQIMENWAFEPEVMRAYARHWQTGEVIPEELITQLENSRHFNQGFATVEYLAASFLDMSWHTLQEAPGLDAGPFEDAAMERIGLPAAIISRYRSPYFQHIFSGGYSAGYYSYLWAEVLDADAFAAFQEKDDLFDADTARSFRENILSRGGSEDSMALYLRFRGQAPDPEALLKRRGLLEYNDKKNIH